MDDRPIQGDRAGAGAAARAPAGTIADAWLRAARGLGFGVWQAEQRQCSGQNEQSLLWNRQASFPVLPMSFVFFHSFLFFGLDVLIWKPRWRVAMDSQRARITGAE